MATDKFVDALKSLVSPVTKSELVDIASTDYDFTNLPRALYFGTAGTCKLLLQGDSTAISLANVSAGQLLPFRASRIYKTGTSATGILGVY